MDAPPAGPAVPLFSPTAAQGQYGGLRAAGVMPASYSEDPGFVAFLVRGTLMKLVTFGLYRFWFVTELRRRLWHATKLGHDGLEYLGTGKELLIGFLFALAILVPLNLLVFAGALGLSAIHPVLSFAAGALLWFFGNFAVFRARRYRLTRTVFRGVRFWMDGSAVAYTLMALGWSLLSFVTLGLALPWHLAALERYKMRHSLYGDLRGDFVSTGWELFKRGSWLWLLGAIAVVAGIVASVMGLADRDFAAIAAVVPLLILGAFLLIPVFLAILRRWLISGFRFGPVGFVCEIGAGRFYAHYVKWFFANWGWALLFGAGAAGIAALLFGLTRLDPELLSDADRWRRPDAAMISLLASAAGYMLFLLGFSAVKIYFITRGLWEATVEATRVTGVAALENVRQTGAGSSAIGEGLADALDVGGL